VAPDIEVDKLPNVVAAGRDPQLERAIGVIKERVKENPPKMPKRPPYPIKR
jgi:tricorn protease